MKAEQLRNPAGVEGIKPKSPLLSLREIVGIGSERFKKALGNTAKGRVRFGASLLLFAATLFSPVDASVKPVNAESNPQQANTLTLLHGNDSERRDRLIIMLLPQNGTTTKMLQEVAADVFLIPPTNEFKNKTNVYKTDPTEDLRCNQQGICDWETIDRQIDRIIAQTGVIPHETLVVVKSNQDFGGNGRAKLLPDRSLLPDIYSSSVIVRPVNTPPEFREFRAAGTITHELWGHALAGFFDDEGHGDLMDTGGRPNFSLQHAQYLRDLMRLTPQNYQLPKNEIRIESIGIFSAGGGSESSQNGISAVVFTPSGTKQLYSEVRPDDGEGPSIIEHIKDLGLIHAWSEIGKNIPYSSLIPSKPYTWKVCSSGLSLPLSAQGPDQDSRWTQVEAWPGKFFPNPCVEVKFETPDGKFRVYLPVVGKAVQPTLKSLSEYSDPKYGWKPDADYGSGVIGPSAADLERWGREKPLTPVG